ncbi:ABC transporter permease, partial [Paenibacillus sepulcri]|nr:ABC transporter permease [Paenibacillus sepulcri]
GRTLDARIKLAQIIALRNAGDDEFPALCERAASEGLKPADIHAAIKDWRADTMRI